MQSESGRRNDMNNMIGRRLLFAGIGFLILGIAATASAQVDVYYDHGTTCQPGFNVFTQTAYGEPGIGNFSNSSEARVFCPMNRAEFRNLVWPTTKIETGWVNYIDNARSAPFWCYMWVTENTGATWWSSKKYTCSVNGGCVDLTTEFVGSNTIRWFNPFGANTFFNEPTVGYSCSIARVENSASWVTSYNTFTVPSNNPQ
jgi:hypothetical protein